MRAMGLLVAILPSDGVSNAADPISSTATPVDLQVLQSRLQSATAMVLPTVVQLRVGESQGSGVVVSASGLVLTAAHVVKAPGQEAKISLADGTELLGQTLGLDEQADTGMIQINDAREFAFAPLGDSTSLERGQWCLAIGFPQGQTSDGRATVRLGRVLFTSRTIIGTDCTLIGGDSGGPLINLNGEVIGIHSRIGARLTTNLHVPSRVFQNEWRRLEAGEVVGPRRNTSNSDEKAEHPLIGVTGMPDRVPCTIASVLPNSPAARAGLQAGDVVQKVDGSRVADFRRLAWMLHEMQPGQRVMIELLRDGKQHTIALKLGATMNRLPGGAPPKRGDKPPPSEPAH
ncbi:MAG: trypsin-like peptidase domain-containing protein [Planctomycetales bacterium]|nr:trypsin-like peptidase domain-containing protein [Planctomycetales bacterium]